MVNLEKKFSNKKKTNFIKKILQAHKTWPDICLINS